MKRPLFDYNHRWLIRFYRLNKHPYFGVSFWVAHYELGIIVKKLKRLILQKWANPALVFIIGKVIAIKTNHLTTDELWGEMVLRTENKKRKQFRKFEKWFNKQHHGKENDQIRKEDGKSHARI